MQKIKIFTHVFENDNAAFNPELWAKEGLRVLYENLVMGQLVHRDFETSIQQFGDVVNTRRPARFTAVNKKDADSVTTQDATATNVQVLLNQHKHVSFIIKDGEESKSMESLVDQYLVHAMEAIAQDVDLMLISEKYAFLNNVTGQLGVDPTKSTLIDTQVKLDELNAPQNNRSLVISPAMQGAFLNIADFTRVNESGDGGNALTRGRLGHKFSMDIVMSQNAKNILATDTVTNGLVNNVAGYAAGTTTMTVDGFSAAIVAGSWFTVAGDLTPQVVTSTVGGATPTSITFSPGLRTAVVNNATTVLYTPALIDLAAGYAAQDDETYVIDGITLPPRLGQMISDGTAIATTNFYGAMGRVGGQTAVGARISRPLDAAVADDAALGLGPAGDYGFAFHKEALALVSRPLAQPASGTGALSAVADFEGIGVRVVITYDGEAQGHRVTVDLLCGTKVLDANLGVVLLG